MIIEAILIVVFVIPIIVISAVGVILAIDLQERSNRE